MDTCLGPPEADPVLLVDANAVLPFPIPFQGFQVITGRDSQVRQSLSVVEEEEFRTGSVLELGGADSSGRFRALTIEQVLGALIAKCQDHDRTVAHLMCYIKFEKER